MGQENTPDTSENPFKFRELTKDGTGRVFTKHFTNLVPVLDINLLSFLSFLIYQSEPDNTIKATVNLMLKYGEANEQVREHYKPFVHQTKRRKVWTSRPAVLKIFKRLVDLQLLIPTDENKVYLINPNLTYHKFYVSTTFYNLWIRGGSPQEYIDHLKNRKENYKKHE